MTKQSDDDTGGSTDLECEDTIELEFSAEQMLALSRAEAAVRSNPYPVPSPAKSLANAPKDQRGAWPAIILLILAASVLSGGIAYLATTPAQPLPLDADTGERPAALQNTAPPSADNTPVRFTNPFDVTEVFEFPLGTSATEVRQAVANLLLQRAQARQNSLSKFTRERRKAAEVAPVTNTSLAKRS
jgi:hypothetical protein